MHFSFGLFYTYIIVVNIMLCENVYGCVIYFFYFIFFFLLMLSPSFMEKFSFRFLPMFAVDIYVVDDNVLDDVESVCVYYWRCKEKGKGNTYIRHTIHFFE